MKILSTEKSETTWENSNTLQRAHTAGLYRHKTLEFATGSQFVKHHVIHGK
jgi:hypothetical protein